MLVAPNHLALPKPRWDEYFERQPEQFVAPVTVQLGASSIYLVNGPVTVEDEYRVRQVLEDLCPNPDTVEPLASWPQLEVIAIEMSKCVVLGSAALRATVSDVESTRRPMVELSEPPFGFCYDLTGYLTLAGRQFE
jgi:hypothetical protein